MEKIETALLCGYSSVEVNNIKIPLSSWELNPNFTRKDKEKQAKENAKEIYTLITKEL